MNDHQMQKEQAQKRVDRIFSFRDELVSLEQTGVLTLSEDQKKQLTTYHDDILRTLASQFDVDTSSVQKQLSWGMRIISFLGAAAISAAVFFFFYRYWGLLTTPWQVAILIAGPVLATLGVEFSARKEKTLYFATIVGLVAFASFILNLSVLGKIFNITPSPNAFLAWAVFALILAYTYGLKILQIAGILCLMSYLSAEVGTWSGCYWLSFGERPENFLISGILLFSISFIPHRKLYDFPFMYRFFGLLAVFISILILADWGQLSYIMIPAEQVEHIYQISGFIVAGLVIWFGIRKQWPTITNLGATFFAIYLYTKFYDWWWEWMPKYLFFLIIGLVAVFLLLLFKRLRKYTEVKT